MDSRPETLVDFHTHSHFSDGVLSPERLVARARDVMAAGGHEPT